jgi:hypothetical protein
MDNPTSQPEQNQPNTSVPELPTPAEAVPAAPAAGPVEPAAPPAPVALPVDPAPAAPAPVIPTEPPLQADDVDVIEKEWVDKAEQIVKQTEGDPYKEEEAIEDLQIDYLKQRYGKDIKKAQDG